MGTAVETYSARGFRHTAIFAAGLAGTSGLVAWLSAPVAVDCTRLAPTRVDCVVEHRLLDRLPLPAVTLTDVASVEVAYASAEAPRVGERPRNRAPIPRLRFVAASDASHIAAHGDGPDLERVRDEITRMLADPGVRDLATTARGKPGVHRWAVGGLACGLALVPLWVLGWFFPALRPRSARPRGGGSQRPRG